MGRGTNLILKLIIPCVIVCFLGTCGRGKLAKEIGISDLRFSSKKVGKLYPILLDNDGNIIDGKHRLAADENWPKVRLEHIKSEKARLLARALNKSKGKVDICKVEQSSTQPSTILLSDNQQKIVIVRTCECKFCEPDDREEILREL